VSSILKRVKTSVTETCVAGLLLFSGVMLILEGIRGPAVRAWLGVALIAVGLGVLWRHRRARWLALGACFLWLAAAGAVPGLVLLAVPFQGDFDGSMRVNVLWFIVAFAVGAIGYKGLAYFRSEQARVDYAGGEVAARNALLSETSSAVMLSAGVWVLVIVIAEFFGLGAPRWLFAHERQAPPMLAPGPLPVIEDTYFQVTRDPAVWAGNSPAAVKFRVLPDLIPLGLCYREAKPGRTVDLAYANVGLGRGYRNFYYDARFGENNPAARRGIELTVPDPDAVLFVFLGSDKPWLSGEVWVDLDTGRQLAESDEFNNSARFPIVRNVDGSLVMPACSSVRLRIVAPDGSESTAESTPPPPPLPDLVPLGLCARGNVLVGVQFTNRGTYVVGRYQIAQGRLPGDLQLVDKTYLSVPGPYEDMGFNVGVVPVLVGKRGQSADIAVQLDYTDAIHESNETNNITRARVTRLADGSLDLPQCDALALQAADPGWVDKGIVSKPAPAAQPVFVPAPMLTAKPRKGPKHRTGSFPDLVVLGACITRERGEVAFRVAFANVGKVEVSRPYEIRDELGSTTATHQEASSFPPGTLWTQYYYIQPVPGRTYVTIDSLDQIAELDETNNSLEIDTVFRREGGFKLPDCAPQMKTVAHWEAMMREFKGN